MYNNIIVHLSTLIRYFSIYILQVWKEDKFVARVTLKIATDDGPDFHTVFCVASQVGGNHKNVKIEIFPEVKKTNNWELYERIEKMNVYL